jgi:hypothetical protein
VRIGVGLDPAQPQFVEQVAQDQAQCLAGQPTPVPVAVQAVADFGAALRQVDGEYRAGADQAVRAGIGNRPDEDVQFAALALDVGHLLLGLRGLRPRRVAPVAHHLRVGMDGEQRWRIVGAHFAQAQPCAA